MNTNDAYVYLPAVSKFSDFQAVSEAVAVAGLDRAATAVGGSFAEWLAQLPQGCGAWVYSLREFWSVTELMAHNEALAARGIALRSISEPWFNDPDTSSSQTLIELFRLGSKLHQPASAPSKAPKSGSSDPRRVELAIELRKKQNTSVVRACQLADCSVVEYYQYLKKQNNRP